ncbi:Alpha/beta knot methyltransferase [Halteromyces radiatus]|uniref:Alpha/beta knot methyltransferase n=1 Tax=Halteromyces radiatus TaxID=101107 RepID=UPI00221FA4DD|nr:Alpha/beta knot methyltransferase [Halteromyces radiatus]KAI8098766.1 Alpha/beta knot methyltransferase [Halteromyces radiatus]
MSSKPALYQFPKLFKRLASQQNKYVQHFIKLREGKQYRLQQNTVLVQGMKTIRELRDEGQQIKSLVVTAEREPYTESAIKFPALQVIQNPDAFLSEYYYLVDVDLTRRILGTASRPGRHEVFAEIPIPDHTLPSKDQVDRFLVCDHVNDPGNLGTLIRTGKALGWDSGVLTTGTCDFYNDKTIRASRALNLRWKYNVLPISQLVEFLKSYDMTPLVADMMPQTMNTSDLWSPLTGYYDQVKNQPTIGTGPWLWNFKDKEPMLPKRPALILSSEHKGVQGLDDEIRISMPMANNVESMNVASVGGILMNELNRLIK